MALLPVRTFDPKMVVITFGVTPISGYAEGTFVRVKRSGDAFTKSKGAGVGGSAPCSGTPCGVALMAMRSFSVSSRTNSPPSRHSTRVGSASLLMVPLE